MSHRECVAEHVELIRMVRPIAPLKCRIQTNQEHDSVQTPTRNTHNENSHCPNQAAHRSSVSVQQRTSTSVLAPRNQLVPCDRVVHKLGLEHNLEVWHGCEHTYSEDLAQLT